MMASMMQATRNGARSSTQPPQSDLRRVPIFADACSTVTDMASRRLAFEHRRAQYALLRNAFAGERCGNAAVPHDEHSIGDMHKLLHVTGIEKYRVALCSEIAHELEDLAF